MDGTVSGARRLCRERTDRVGADVWRSASSTGKLQIDFAQILSDNAAGNDADLSFPSVPVLMRGCRAPPRSSRGVSVAGAEPCSASASTMVALAWCRIVPTVEIGSAGFGTGRGVRFRVPVRGAARYAPLVSAIVPRRRPTDARRRPLRRIRGRGAVGLVEVREERRRTGRTGGVVSGPGAAGCPRELLDDASRTATGRTTKRCATGCESGAYSQSTTGPVVPETDTTTFNGHQWDAGAAYESRSAVGAGPVRATGLSSRSIAGRGRTRSFQYDIFKRTTFKRDDAHYAGVQDLIVIGANHVLSMVDAFATFRLSGPTDGRRGRTRLARSCVVRQITRAKNAQLL